MFLQRLRPAGAEKKEKSQSDDIFVERYKRVLKSPIGATYKEMWRCVHSHVLKKEGKQNSSLRKALPYYCPFLRACPAFGGRLG
jgi:hypothetical protein